MVMLVHEFSFENSRAFMLRTFTDRKKYVNLVNVSSMFTKSYLQTFQTDNWKTIAALNAHKPTSLTLILSQVLYSQPSRLSPWMTQ